MHTQDDRARDSRERAHTMVGWLVCIYFSLKLIRLYAYISDSQSEIKERDATYLFMYPSIRPSQFKVESNMKSLARLFCVIIWKSGVFGAQHTGVCWFVYTTK